MLENELAAVTARQRRRCCVLTIATRGIIPCTGTDLGSFKDAAFDVDLQCGQSCVMLGYNHKRKAHRLSVMNNQVGFDTDYHDELEYRKHKGGVIHKR